MSVCQEQRASEREPLIHSSHMDEPYEFDVDGKAAFSSAECDKDTQQRAVVTQRRLYTRDASWCAHLQSAAALLYLLLSVIYALCQFFSHNHSMHGHGQHEMKVQHMYEAYQESVLSDARCHMRTNRFLEGCRQTLDDRIAAAEAQFLRVPSAESARAALQRYTSVPHMAGEPNDLDSARNLVTEWSELLGIPTVNATEFMFDAGTEESREFMQHSPPMSAREAPRVWADTYSVWLNQPVKASLSLMDERGNDFWTANLDEDVLSDDATSAQGRPAFHGFSASGNAKGHVVFAGGGSLQDFELLKQNGVDVKGKIVLVRYGDVFRGVIVRAAEEAGAAAVLMYTDPAEDGTITEANGYKAYPEGPARHPSSVQRGSVQALSIMPGDPSTPDEPSYRNATRFPSSATSSLPRIPSIPISFANAKQLLADMEGQGLRAEQLRAGFGGAIPNVTYWTGPSRHLAHVENVMSDQVQDIWNVYAVIPGHLDDERIMIGNHRDAWVFGAGDPSSGSAVMHEVVKGLGQLVQSGWRPMRTIVLASWDAEEYGLIGSTEFGEDFAEFIQSHVAMYHNLDMAVCGSVFEANASPSLQALLHDVAHSVPDPKQPATHNMTLRDVGSLGSGSDFTVFLQRLGIASSDIRFSRGPSDPVYHYHSNYDSFTWMDRYGDPGFVRHEAIAKAYGLLALRSADAIFLPISLRDYARELHKYYEMLLETARATGVELRPTILERLRTAIENLGVQAQEMSVHQSKLEERVRAVFSRPNVHMTQEVRQLLRKAHNMNTHLREFEQGFLDMEGLASRPWYRHLGVAPGRWLGYGATIFPGVTESMTLDHGLRTSAELSRLAKSMEQMAKKLEEANARWSRHESPPHTPPHHGPSRPEEPHDGSRQPQPPHHGPGVPRPPHPGPEPPHHGPGVPRPPHPGPEPPHHGPGVPRPPHPGPEPSLHSFNGA